MRWAFVLPITATSSLGHLSLVFYHSAMRRSYTAEAETEGLCRTWAAALIRGFFTLDLFGLLGTQTISG